MAGITLAGAAAIGSMAVGAYSVYSTEQGADEQDDIARANAERQRMESEEAVRRLTARQEQAESQAKAMASASGVKVTGSVEDYLDIMAKTHKDEADWLVKSGLSAESIMAREGELQADMTRRSGRMRAASTFLSAANSDREWFS